MTDGMAGEKGEAVEDCGCRVINGVTFYCDGLKLTDHMLGEMEKFSRSCDKGIYSVYLDKGHALMF